MTTRTRYRRRQPKGFLTDCGTIFSPALPFEMSLAVWGAVFTGNTAEPIACMAEGDRDNCQAFGGMWDRTARSLTYEMICTPDGYKPIPEWWALPYVTQHILRGHVAYPPEPTMPEGQS